MRGSLSMRPIHLDLTGSRVNRSSGEGKQERGWQPSRNKTAGVRGSGHYKLLRGLDNRRRPKVLMSFARPMIEVEKFWCEEDILACSQAWAFLNQQPIDQDSAFSQHRQQNPPTVSFNSSQPMVEHGKSGPEKPEDSQCLQQRLSNNNCVDGRFNEVSGSLSSGGNGSMSLLTREPYSMLGSMTSSPFSSSSSTSANNVSHNHANPRTTSWTFPSNWAVDGILDPAYFDWQHAPGTGLPAHQASTFASSQNGNLWQNQPASQYRGTDNQMLGYNNNLHYTLGESTFNSAQTPFRPANLDFAPHGMVKAMPEEDELNLQAQMTEHAPVPLYDSSASFSSNGASEIMEAMMVNGSDSAAQSPWTIRGNHLGADSLPCIVDSGGPSPVEQPSSSPVSWDVPAGIFPAPQATVSPKLLRLRPTPTPTSSSESIRTSFLANSSGEASHMHPSQLYRQSDTSLLPLAMDIGHLSAPETYTIANLSRTLGQPHNQPRKSLPDRAPRQSQRGDNNDHEMKSRRSHRDRVIGDNVKKQETVSCLLPQMTSGIPTSTNSPPLLRHQNKNARAQSQFSPVSRPLPLLSPAPLKPSTSYHGEILSPASGSMPYTDPEAEERRVKDEFLVECKQRGMTYKQIRLEGGFTEAESTLRGRYRTLTKSREARVRKPEWTAFDVILLEKAVRSYAKHPSDPNSHKIPWKKVGEYIISNGGSYHFGNSTCRKRWDDLVREHTALGRDIRRPFYEQEAEAEDGIYIYSDTGSRSRC